MAVNINCPNCGETFGKDTENPKIIPHCGNCGETDIPNPRGYEEYETNGAYRITPEQALEDAGMEIRDLVIESIVPACCSHTCMVEPDGKCEHGFYSAARELGLA
jgi:ribosomal protein S27AE